MVRGRYKVATSQSACDEVAKDSRQQTISSMFTALSGSCNRFVVLSAVRSAAGADDNLTNSLQVANATFVDRYVTINVAHGCCR